MKVEEKLYENIWRDAYPHPNKPVKIHEHDTGTVRIDWSAKVTPPGDRLLDIGCGDGSYCDLVRGKFKEMYGVDISAAAVAIAKKHNIHATQHNIHDGPLPFTDNFFDVVASGATIEHVFEPSYLVAEAYRMLKPGGTFILNTPNIRYIRHIFTLLIQGRFPTTSGDTMYSYDGGHIHYFTFADIVSLLQKHHFHIERQLGITTPEAMRHPVYRILSLLGSRFQREFLGMEILIIAKK